MEHIPGLTLARELYTASLPLLRELIPHIMDRAAVGLVGEGSECFGCDDAVSHDHDWGPAFCLWLEADICAADTKRVADALACLPVSFQGFPTRMQPDQWGGRVGLLSMQEFYARFLGKPTVPDNWKAWRAIPEKFLAVATNGEVFTDPVGRFSAIRQGLLEYYPEDWRRKKIAARCMTMAQTGQYNLLRAKTRDDAVCGLLTRARFAEAALSMTYLLNRRYMPFYKWAGKCVRPLPVLGPECANLLDALARSQDNEAGRIENFCAQVAATLRAQGLSGCGHSWLWEHGPEVHATIEDSQLRAMPVQWD